MNSNPSPRNPNLNYHPIPLPPCGGDPNPTLAPCCPNRRRRRAVSSGRCSGREASAPLPLIQRPRKRTTGGSWRRCCSSASPSSSPRSTPLYTPSKNSRTPDPLVSVSLASSDLAFFGLSGCMWLRFVSALGSGGGSSTGGSTPTRSLARPMRGDYFRSLHAFY
jgi:hypothetical protein